MATESPETHFTMYTGILKAHHFRALTSCSISHIKEKISFGELSCHALSC
jgi:hypothetical protein